MLETVMGLAGSPWIYAIVALFVLVDGVVPALPSDTLVICLSALSVTGAPSLPGLVASAAAGAVAGDFLSYTLGRRAVGRFAGPRRGAAGAAFDTARRALDRRGGSALVVGHFLPGGRAATTLAAGWLAFPVRRFVAATAVAGVVWAIYISGLGLLGGLAFADRPFLGAIPGLVLGACVAGYLQVRNRRARPPAARAPETAPAPATATARETSPEITGPNSSNPAPVVLPATTGTAPASPGTPPPAHRTPQTAPGAPQTAPNSPLPVAYRRGRST